MQNCKSCLFYYKLMVDPQKAEIVQICRRFPPIAGSGVSGTHDDYWCGEWRSKDEGGSYMKKKKKENVSRPAAI
jgi:hypothetical protein